MRVEDFTRLITDAETIEHDSVQQPPPLHAIRINFDATWHQGQTGLGFIVIYHCDRTIHCWVGYD